MCSPCVTAYFCLSYGEQEREVYAQRGLQQTKERSLAIASFWKKVVHQQMTLYRASAPERKTKWKLRSQGIACIIVSNFSHWLKHKKDQPGNKQTWANFRIDRAVTHHNHWQQTWFPSISIQIVVLIGYFRGKLTHNGNHISLRFVKF